MFKVGRVGRKEGEGEGEPGYLCGKKLGYLVPNATTLVSLSWAMPSDAEDTVRVATSSWGSRTDLSTRRL